MKFVCDKCGFCCESDDNHPAIWIGTKTKDGMHEWQHCCYECGKQMIDFVESKLNERGESNEK